MQRRLGRGLGSLLSGPDSSPEPTREIALDAIRPNPFQPRQSFDPAELDELRASIVQHGVLQPVVLRRAADGFELVSGERRWRAARLAGRKTIPASIREDVSDEAMLELALVENVQRRDLDPIEKAQGYRTLMDVLGAGQDVVAERVGLQRTTIANHLRLLELPERVQEAVRKGLLSMGHARALLGLEGEAPRIRLMEEVVRQELSVRDVERRVRAARRAPQQAGAQRTSPAPPWAHEVEKRVRESLGTRVSVRPGAGFRGQIVLDYADRPDLERLIDRLAPRRTL